MPISFNNIPADLKIPLYWVEVDPSQAGIPMIHQPSLLVGIATSLGAAPHDIALAIGTQAQADHAFGAGSMLARLFRTFFANNFANEVWGLPVGEPTGGTAATGTITVANPPTDAGTIHLYIAGQHVPVNVAGTDTTANIAAEIAAEINATPDLPVSASSTTNVVTLTCRWKGLSGNDIRLDLNYYGTIGGEQLPPGLGLTFPAGAAGVAGAATGSGSGTQLTIASMTSGSITIGATVTGTGVPVGTIIMSQQSGTTGQAGVYITNQATTAASAALTFAGPAGPANFLGGGAGVPVFTNAISNLGEKNFEYVALPWTDSTTLNAWELEYGFEDVGRWGQDANQAPVLSN